MTRAQKRIMEEIAKIEEALETVPPGPQPSLPASAANLLKEMQESKDELYINNEYDFKGAKELLWHNLCLIKDNGGLKSNYCAYIELTEKGRDYRLPLQVLTKEEVEKKEHEPATENNSGIEELKEEIAYKIDIGKSLEDRLYYPPTIKVDGLNDNDLLEMIEENKKDVEYLESQLPTSENNSATVPYWILVFEDYFPDQFKIIGAAGLSWTIKQDWASECVIAFLLDDLEVGQIYLNYTGKWGMCGDNWSHASYESDRNALVAYLMRRLAGNIKAGVK